MFIFFSFYLYKRIFYFYSLIMLFSLFLGLFVILFHFMYSMQEVIFPTTGLDFFLIPFVSIQWLCNYLRFYQKNCDFSILNWVTYYAERWKVKISILLSCSHSLCSLSLSLLFRYINQNNGTVTPLKFSIQKYFTHLELLLSFIFKYTKSNFTLSTLYSFRYLKLLPQDDPITFC